MTRLPDTGARLWRGLTLQLFLLILLPLTLLLLLVAVGGSLLHQRAMRDLVGERDQRAARAAAAFIDDQLQHHAAAIQGLARVAAAAPDPATSLRDLTPLLPQFAGNLALFTSDGDLLAPPNAPPTWREHLPAAQSQNVTFLYLPESGDDQLLVIATAGDITAAGLLSVSDLARRALGPAFLGAEIASAFVVTPNGQYVYRAGPPPSLEPNPLQHPGVVSGLRGESGATYFGAGDGERVVAFSPITTLGWALVVEEPWQAVADPLLHTTEWAPLVLVPVLIIALLGLIFGARQVVQPLRSLEEKATALAWGDFKAIEEPVGGIDEIQGLQTELIRMARRLRDAQQSLRGYLGAVTAGQEDERRRLARELHDDAIQSLIALNQRLQLAQLDPDNSGAAAQLQEMQQMVTQLIADLRRQIHALRPIYLEDLGLLPALQMLAQEVQNAQSLSVHFHSEGQERRLPPHVELALYRIAQEALNNVARHAQANEATLTLTFTSADVTLTVQDDGRGFTVPESPGDLAPQGHFGLLGIYERAQLIGADLMLHSRPGQGTRLQIQIQT